MSTKTEEYDYINPQHYVQGDGKQTWERMIDIWGIEATRLFCAMTAFKYQDRIGNKPGENDEREMGKIQWYLGKAKELQNQIEKDWDNKIVSNE